MLPMLGIKAFIHARMTTNDSGSTSGRLDASNASETVGGLAMAVVPVIVSPDSESEDTAASRRNFVCYFYYTPLD
jgi:hypothetical protein